MSLGRNATYNMIGQAAPIVVALITIPIYLHLIGIERYGILAICWMFLGYFGLFDLGLTRATSHRIALYSDGKDADARARAFWTAVSVSVLLSIVGAVILYAGARWYFAGPFEIPPVLRRESLQALPILAIALPGGILAGVSNGSLQGRERFLEVNAVSITTGMLTQIVPVLVAWLYGPNLAELLLTSVCVQLVMLAVSLILCRRFVTQGRPFSFDRAEARFLLRYGGWISLSALIAPIMNIVDRFVIGAVYNTAAVATYTVPSQLAQRSSMIPYSFAVALFPRLSAERDVDRRIAITQRSTRIAMALMTLPVLAAICIMGPFLTIWLQGALPREAVAVGQIALLGWWVNGIGINCVALVQASGRPRVTALLHTVELPVYFALLWLLTKHFGLVGAAAAFATRCAIDCLVLCIIAYGRRADLSIYVFPVALLVGSVILIGDLDVKSIGSAWTIMLMGAATAWSWWVLPGDMRRMFRRRLGRIMSFGARRKLKG